MRNEDRVRLRHMLDAAETALNFVAGRGRAELDRDRMLLFAVVRALEVMGEAAAKVGEPARAELTGVPWASIVSMRNRLIHGYFDIDTEIVWKTVTVELPPLLPLLEKAVAAD